MMRTLPVRLVAAAFAVMALVWPGYGAIDLSVTWDPEWNPVLSGGWGMFFGVIVAVPFAVVSAAPRRGAAAVWSLLLTCAALAVAAAISAEPQAAPLVAWLVVGTVSVATPRVTQAWRAVHVDVRGWRVLAAVVVSSPWLVYAWAMSGNNRQGRYDTDFTNRVDHYSVQAALGLVLFLLVLLAVIWPAGRGQLASTAAVCALYLAVLSLRWPDFPGAMQPAWAAGALMWSVGVGAWGWAVGPISAATAPRAP